MTIYVVCCKTGEPHRDDCDQDDLFVASRPEPAEEAIRDFDSSDCDCPPMECGPHTVKVYEEAPR